MYLGANIREKHFVDPSRQGYPYPRLGWPLTALNLNSRLLIYNQYGVWVIIYLKRGCQLVALFHLSSQISLANHTDIKNPAQWRGFVFNTSLGLSYFPSPGHADETYQEVKVEHVIDGDTVIVSKSFRKIRIRLDSINILSFRHR
jgi:hypothetical protein